MLNYKEVKYLKITKPLLKFINSTARYNKLGCKNSEAGCTKKVTYPKLFHMNSKRQDIEELTPISFSYMEQCPVLSTPVVEEAFISPLYSHRSFIIY